MKSKDATALELYNRPKTEIKYIIEGVMPAVGYHILAGPEKDGKSTFATQFALAIAAGNKLMGHFKTTIVVCK
ncbi:AAA family ATPase [Desulfobacter latus]|uniref:AAA family ATPase n=1 Tax=Desulfobacter latus TaxID=2292 RepID=A0A850T590_9BACT|nr:AAA family ATPase [Desulfobacter latus]NWH06953.1 AAA family ATPase [Desulfobacter latus]